MVCTNVEEIGVKKSKFSEKISKFYQRTKLAVAVFLSAAVLTEGIIKAEDGVKFTPIPKVEVADVKPTNSMQERTKKSFLESDLNQEGTYIDFNYKILGDDISSHSQSSDFKTISREISESLHFRGEEIEINAELTQGKKESRLNSSYVNGYSFSKYEAIPKRGDISIYFSFIHSKNFRLGVGPAYEHKTENFTGKDNSQERDFLYVFPDGSYWMVHSKEISSKSKSEYEHHLLGFGGKIDANISVIGMILPIRLEIYRIKGDADFLSNYNQTESISLSAYDSTGQYLGDYGIITRTEIKTSRTYAVDKRVFKLGLPFASEKTLIKPKWIRTKLIEYHSDYMSKIITNIFGIDMKTKVKSWKDAELILGGGYEFITQDDYKISQNRRYERKEQEQRGKITFGIQF